MSTNRAALRVLGLLAALAVPAHATWDMSYGYQTNSNILNNGGVSATDYAWVRIAMVPGIVSGIGKARETTCVTQQSAFGLGTAASNYAWKHVGPPPIGEVEWIREVEIRGNVKIPNGPSAGSVSGFSRVLCIPDNTPTDLRVDLTSANLATSSQIVMNLVLGPIPIPGLSPAPTLAYSVAIGTGSRSDDGGGIQGDSKAVCPCSNFIWDRRASLRIQVWAFASCWNWINPFSSPAEVACDGRAVARGIYWLLEHPTCPTTNPPMSATSGSLGSARPGSGWPL